MAADRDDMLAGGGKPMPDGEELGAVDSPAFSRRLGEWMAPVHPRPDAARPAKRLEAVGGDPACAAAAEPIPYYDPGKSRARA